MSDKKTVIDELECINGQILALDPSDKEGIVEVGALLEQLIDDIPEDSGGAEELLTLALTGLQAVYEETVSDSCEAVDAIVDAIAAVSGQLDGEAGTDGDSLLEKAGRILRDIISAEDEKAASNTEDKPPAETTAQAQTPEKPAERTEMATTLPEDADMAILAEFIVECLDHISAAEASLLDLENNPDDVELINTIFRAFHTIKGTSGFLGLDRTQRLAHLAENLLDRARDGEIKIQGGYADLSLRSCDALREIIEGLQGVEPGGELAIPEDFDGLLEHLENPEAARITDGDAVAEMRVGDILVATGQTTRDQIDKAVSKQGDRPIGETLVEEKAATAAVISIPPCADLRGSVPGPSGSYTWPCGVRRRGRSREAG